MKLIILLSFFLPCILIAETPWPQFNDQLKAAAMPEVNSWQGYQNYVSKYNAFQNRLTSMLSFTTSHDDAQLALVQQSPVVEQSPKSQAVQSTLPGTKQTSGSTPQSNSQALVQPVVPKRTDSETYRVLAASNLKDQTAKVEVTSPSNTFGLYADSLFKPAPNCEARIVSKIVPLFNQTTVRYNITSSRAQVDLNKILSPSLTSTITGTQSITSSSIGILLAFRL